MLCTRGGGERGWYENVRLCMPLYASVRLSTSLYVYVRALMRLVSFARLMMPIPVRRSANASDLLMVK